MKKMLLILMLTLAAALLLTGCASSADTLPSPTPGTGSGNGMIQPLMPDATGNNGMGMNTGLVFVMEMAKKMSACLEDYAKKDPEASKKLHGLIEQIGKKGVYKLKTSDVSNPLTVISTPKPYDPVDGAEKAMVKLCGRSMSTLRESAGERFFTHTFEYSPPRKDIEYKVCVMYYFEA